MLLQEGKDQCFATCNPEVDTTVQNFKYFMKTCSLEMLICLHLPIKTSNPQSDCGIWTLSLCCNIQCIKYIKFNWTTTSIFCTCSGCRGLLVTMLWNTWVAKSEVLFLAQVWLFDMAALTLTRGRKKCCKCSFWPLTLRQRILIHPKDSGGLTNLKFIFFLFRSILCFFGSFECVPLLGPELQQ